MYSFYLEHSEETMPYEYRWGEGARLPSPGEIREVSATGGLDIQNSLGLEGEGQATPHIVTTDEGNQTHGTALSDTPLLSSRLT